MLMQPNTPNPAPPAPVPDYDFILNHGANKPKRFPLPSLGGSKKQRWLIIGLGGSLLILLVILGYSLLFGGSKDQNLLEVAQTQQELIRVSTLGVDHAKSSATRGLAVTTELTLESNQKDVLARLRKDGQKTSTKTLALKKNSQTDDALAQAAQDNHYDDAFTKLIQDQLVAYQKLLKTAYDSTSSQSLKKILNAEFAQAGLLIASTQSS